MESTRRILLLIAVVWCVNGCTVVRFEEQVHSKTLRWGVLTYQRAEAPEYAGAYGAAAAAAAASDSRWSSGSQGSSGKSRSAQEKSLHVAVIQGSEQYRNTAEFFKRGGADEAQALCVLLNEEEENRLARVYGGVQRKTGAGLVQARGGQRIIELLDAADVILRKPVSADGADILVYEPTTLLHGVASGHAQLPGSRRQSYHNVDADSIAEPFGSVEELERGKTVEVTPVIGVVAQSSLEKGQSISSNDVRQVIGALVVGSVFRSDLGERLAIGPYLQLLPHSESGFDRRAIDELSCRVWVDNTRVSQFRLDTVSGDVISAVMDVGIRQHIRAGSALFYSLNAPCTSRRATALIPQLLQAITSLLGIHEESSDSGITASRGEVVKTAMSGPSRYIDLGIQANQIVPFNGRATEFTHWPSIVANELARSGSLEETISIASDNWLIALLAVISLIFAVLIGRLCM